MTLLHKGKTKDVHEHGKHTLRLVFTDRVTKNDAGEVDPGGNNLSEDGAPGQGKACLSMTAVIFEHLAKHGVPTHMVSHNLADLSMFVRKATVFGSGLEWVCRWVGTGSFVRRYKNVPGVKDGMRFESPVFEITIKDDAGGDPLIVPSAIAALGIIPADRLNGLIEMNAKAMALIHDLFRERGLDLWDIKIEWGQDSANDEFLLIDEVSANSCRAFDAESGEPVKGAAISGRFEAA